MPEQEKFVTNQQKRFACSIIESRGNTNYQEPVQMTTNVAKYIEINTGARFAELVADYIK